jgi:indole-3-glycerol phosphate synthase / phosphoribosylanthranilate isomerase
MKTTGVLSRILTRTRERVAERRKQLPLDPAALVAQATHRRPFAPALTRAGQVNIIGEFKRRSPSRGILREDLGPAQVAQAYEVAGAAALSVLTEEQFFGGSVEDLKEARQATLLPTLRKDFIVDPYQVWEALSIGADAVLLIVAAVNDVTLAHLWAAVRDARLEAIFEVHDADDLERALRLEPRMVGVNNRNLSTLVVDLQTSLDLVSAIPDDVVAIAESGLRGAGEIRRLRDAGFDAFLVGEHLMLADDPGAALEELVSGCAVLRSSTPRGSGRVTVKICGITSKEDALLAVSAGADAVGFVFWPGSPRTVDPQAARAIAAAVPPFILRVGVFVDATAEEMRRVADEVGLDIVQLHGNESPEAVSRAPRRAVKAVRVGPGFRPDEALRYDGTAAALLLDTRVEGDGRPGGTGRVFDWSLVRPVREGTSFLILAGGLTPENVGEAVAAVRPDGVDVSSGVESAPGKKDPAKMRAFVEAVRGRR